MLADLIVILLAGAIGYGTNWLAVKMLFRPLEPVVVLGRRLPFTPGMIPARKDEIVEGIARGIAEHILTAEVIARELDGVDLLAPVEVHVRAVIARVAAHPATAEEARVQVVEAVEAMAGSQELHAALAERIRPGLRAGLGGAAAGGALLLTSLPWLRALPRKTIAAFAGGAAALAAERFADEVGARLARSAAAAVRAAVLQGGIDAAAREALARFPDALFAREGRLRPGLERSLKDAIPEAARGLDVEGVIRRRLATFSAADLEALVLSASARHLRAITWLGGLLGALVGAAQVLLRRLLA